MTEKEMPDLEISIKRIKGEYHVTYKGNYFEILTVTLAFLNEYMHKLKEGNYFVDRDAERKP